MHAKKLVDRELQRLRTSFELARADGYRKFIMFLHYPPANIPEERSGFTDIAEEYGTEQVIYAHSPGRPIFTTAYRTEENTSEVLSQAFLYFAESDK